MLERAKPIGEQLGAALGALRDEGLLAEVRGDGAIWGAAMLPDVSALEVRDAMLTRGVIARPIGSHTVAFCPPLVIDESQIERSTTALGDALREVTSRLARSAMSSIFRFRVRHRSQASPIGFSGSAVTRSASPTPSGTAPLNSVARMLQAVLDVAPPDALAGHFHDTMGHALDNIVVALDYGLRVFDASCGGLGGCPYAPGAAGNVATERVVARLADLGFATGLDPGRLAAAAAFARGLRAAG